MKKVLGISLALTSIVILSSCGLQKTENVEPIEGGAMVRQDDKMMERDENVAPQDGDAMMKKDDAMVGEDSVMMKKEMGYTSYSEATLDTALASGQKVALFFHAPWCPSCKALDTTLNNDAIPSDVVVLKVDYDTSTELKKKYGIRSQHTIVALDQQKNMIKKETGSKNIADIMQLF